MAHRYNPKCPACRKPPVERGRIVSWTSDRSVFRKPDPLLPITLAGLFLMVALLAVWAALEIGWL